MADITVTLGLSDIYREVARRSAVVTATDPFYVSKSETDKQKSQLQGEGDRITRNFVEEGAKETLKVYVSRQGDVSGVAYEFDLADSGDIVYRFAENDDPLPTNQTSAITSRLTDNTKDAIIYYTLYSLYRTDGNSKKMEEMYAKVLELVNLITGDLYRLHD